MIGSGTDSSIYRAAGEELLLAERKKIGEIAVGKAAATPAFGLSAKYIIHTVGPSWEDGSHGERDALRSCYGNSLALATELKAESIAFPLISTGVYGLPKDEALNIALSEIGKFLLMHDMTVILVVFDRKAFELSQDLIGKIDEYIDEHGVGIVHEAEYGVHAMNYRRRLEESRGEMARARNRKPDAPFADIEIEGKSLDKVLEGTGKSFRQRLFELIDESGMDDVTVYKRANIDRKVFSRIRCKADYKPTKQTAVAFAIALRLDMRAMLDLLSRAGIAFSPDNRFDLIISYFFTNKIYGIFEINTALFGYGEQLLGG